MKHLKLFEEYVAEATSDVTQTRLDTENGEEKSYPRGFFEDLCKKLQAELGDALLPQTEQVARKGKIFNYGSMFNDYISFSLRLASSKDAERAKEIVEREAKEKLGWGYCTMHVHNSKFGENSEGKSNVFFTLSKKLVSSNGGDISVSSQD